MTFKAVLGMQAIVAMLLAAAIALFWPQEWLPFAIGWGIGIVNFLLLGLVWRRVLDKKPVATTLGLIVIKYSILIGVLHTVVTRWKVPLPFMFMGFGAIVLGFLALGFRELLKRE
jgi:hypothetical protein